MGPIATTAVGPPDLTRSIHLHVVRCRNPYRTPGLARDAAASCGSVVSSLFIAPELNGRVGQKVQVRYIPLRARPLLRAGVLTAEHPATLLRDRDGRLFMPRRMANLISRAAERVGMPAPPAARSSSPWDRAEPYAASFTTTATLTGQPLCETTVDRQWSSALNSSFRPPGRPACGWAAPCAPPPTRPPPRAAPGCSAGSRPGLSMVAPGGPRVAR